jgi:hypothetical protein
MCRRVLNSLEECEVEVCVSCLFNAHSALTAWYEAQESFVQAQAQWDKQQVPPSLANIAHIKAAQINAKATE